MTLNNLYNTNRNIQSDCNKGVYYGKKESAVKRYDRLFFVFIRQTDGRENSVYGSSRTPTPTTSPQGCVNRPLPPSDEGGGFLRSKKTEGEKTPHKSHGNRQGPLVKGAVTVGDWGIFPISPPPYGGPPPFAGEAYARTSRQPFLPCPLNFFQLLAEQRGGHLRQLGVALT